MPEKPAVKGVNKADLILQEIVEKAQDYEANMGQFMASVSEWTDLYKIKPPARKKNRFSNPRLPEFHRATNALATLVFRMMTAKDPYFGLLPVNMNPDYDHLDTLTHVLKTQLKYSSYKPYLLKACNFVIPYGTVICQEDYRVIGVSPFGRRIPVTTFAPRVLDQVFFDRATTDIADADWIATSDVTSVNALRALMDEAGTLKVPWSKEGLQDAIDDKEEASTINQRVLQRLTRDGYSDDAIYKTKKEVLTYYGKLDTLNDGVEYVAAVVNRKHLVRFHANRFQHGKRQFRVAKWIDFDNVLGLGAGQLFAQHHKSLDGNRQRAQDNIVMASYGMFTRKRNTVEDEQLEIGPLKIVDVDAHDDLRSLDVRTDGASAALTLEQRLQQEFRTAFGAPDTLQAIVTTAGTTASEATLAQNEALRYASVKAEHISESLVREHLEVMHWNNVEYIKAPFNINKAGIAKRVYPSDMAIDLDFESRVLTDKDFKPQRLEKILQLIQALISTKSDHPDQLQISILPLVKQAAYMLEVNPQDLIQNPMAARPMSGGDLAGLSPFSAPAPGGTEVVSTPVGLALASQ